MTVQWVIAIGIAILAILALFQDYIRSWLKTPKLEITSSGQITPKSHNNRMNSDPKDWRFLSKLSER